MTQLRIDIPDDLNRQLEAIGREQHRSTDELVRESLRRYVMDERIKTLRKVIGPRAEAQGYATDEDVFRAVS